MANKLKHRALGVLNSKNQGRRRSYNMITDEKLTKMMEVTYQQRTEAKIKWAVNNYNDWRAMRLERPPFDILIHEADLCNLELLTRENFEHSLCRFICEVKKVRPVGDYPGRTLYQMVCSLQNFLRKNDINWKLVHGDTEFLQFQRVLDNVMTERASRQIGLIKKQAEVISMRHENVMWGTNILGEDMPDKLRDTVL